MKTTVVTQKKLTHRKVLAFAQTKYQDIPQAALRLFLDLRNCALVESTIV